MQKWKSFFTFYPVFFEHTFCVFAIWKLLIKENYQPIGGIILDNKIIYDEIEIKVNDKKTNKDIKFDKKLSVSTPVSKNKKSAIKENKTKVIVIDAGHGGEDPGAIGLGGTYEKNIVLAMAKQLRDVLKKNSQYKIILTRETDKFIKLQERAKIAEKNNANCENKCLTNEVKSDIYVTQRSSSYPGSRSWA